MVHVESTTVQSNLGNKVFATSSYAKANPQFLSLTPIHLCQHEPMSIQIKDNKKLDTQET